MFPRIVSFKTPEFLQGFLPNELTVNSYGLCIAAGIIVAYLIILRKTRKQGLNNDNLSELFLWCFAAAFVGGKVLFYLEDPAKYLANPSLMLKNMGNGFVFYGSLLFVVPTMYLWLRKKKIAFWPFMDAVAFGGPVLHAFGRLGCFLAGCCHGKICHNWMGVTYTDPHSVADPKNVPLYPTQLFDIGINLITLAMVYLLSKRQKFEGQLFLLYITLYAIGRTINENFRGDEERGYLFGGLLTYSQFIAALLILASGLLWIYLSRKKAVSVPDHENHENPEKES